MAKVKQKRDTMKAGYARPATSALDAKKGANRKKGGIVSGGKKVETRTAAGNLKKSLGKGMSLRNIKRRDNRRIAARVKAEYAGMAGSIPSSIRDARIKALGGGETG